MPRKNIIVLNDDIENNGLVISELLPGVHGNNNTEFIEIYNPGLEPVDLQGWSLWYQLDENQDAQLVNAWESKTDVPGLGHCLLGRGGGALGTTPDTGFDVPFF